jgi:nucleotide-binding universal stress UspA family protein
MNTLRDRLTASGVDHEVIHAIRGREASEEILSVARDRRAELIVVGLRRRSAVGKLIMGSTGQRVLLEAACPVLAVKG